MHILKASCEYYDRFLWNIYQALVMTIFITYFITSYTIRQNSLNNFNFDKCLRERIITLYYISQTCAINDIFNCFPGAILKKKKNP